MAGGTERPHRGGLSRAALLLLLVLACRARAETLAGSGEAFDQALAAQVFTAALSFMLPRTLDPVAAPRMAGWGLRGITALDPNLVPVMHDADVTLTAPGRVVAVLALPAPADLSGWGVLIAGVSAAAWRDSDVLRRAGTQGMITSFFDEVFNHLDPYSRYVPPDVAAGDRAYRRGAAGVGLLLAARGGGLIVADLVAGGPAAAAGVRAGERLVGIDGRPMTRVDATAAHALLAGEDGSPVTLTLRGRDGRAHTAGLVRALLPADTVLAGRQGNLLLLRVSGFTASTAERLRDELHAGLARRPEPRGVVMDLRGNRGGLLDEAVAAANLVLSTGRIATTQGRNPASQHDWVADGTDVADGLPIVVLVDGRSASAAEVLAAALADDGRAVVVGSETLGKGLVQTVGNLPDGGELFVTWSRVLAPSGWPLQGLGVMPQVCTSLGQDAMQRQLDALNEGEQPMRGVLASHRAARPGVPLAEVLAIRQACPAALGGETDLDAAKFLIGNPIAYATALEPVL